MAGKKEVKAINSPETIIELENLAHRLVEISYPKNIVQKIRGGTLYKNVYAELILRFGNIAIKEIFDRGPIIYKAEVGYEFLISE